VWRRSSRGLAGVIKPVSAFRDNAGRVCRHLSYSLSLGTYVREIEGVACRQSDGRWSLAG
jgi:surface antigen